MDNITLLMEEANRAFKTADHLAYVTYPVVTDRKLLMVIVEHLHRAITKSVEAILAYEYLYKRINHLPRDVSTQFSLFGETAVHYGIKKDLVSIMREINEIVDHRDKSPIEFVRKDRFIIASDTFHLKTVTIEKVKSYIQHIKHLLEKINEAKTIYDGRFSRDSQRRVEACRP